jgi:hypothetical protein
LKGIEMSLQQKLEKLKHIKFSEDYKQAIDDIIAILDNEEKCYWSQWNMPRIRPELKEFMLACEAELKRHDVEKGDSWKTMPVEELIDLFAKLTNEYCHKADDYIDIANGAMMVWYRMETKDV